jgi:hypothetical protein
MSEAYTFLKTNAGSLALVELELYGYLGSISF